MYVPTAELGLPDSVTGANEFNNRPKTDAVAEPALQIEATPTSLSPYEILQEAFTENANGKDLLRVKVKRKTKRHVQVLTEEAKAVSQSYVEALYAANAESLDKENLLAQVDAYYHQLVDSGYNKTAAYKLKQSATFKIRNRFNPEARAKLFQRKAQAAELPPEAPLVPIDPIDNPTVELIEPIETILAIDPIDPDLFEPTQEPVATFVAPAVDPELYLFDPSERVADIEAAAPEVAEPVEEEPVEEEPVEEEPVEEEPVEEEPVEEEPEMIIAPVQPKARVKSRFGIGRVKEIARAAVNIALVGVGLLGLDRLAHANHDLPALDLPQPTPITRNVSVYTSSQDQARAEQRYFTQLARSDASATATPDSAEYPPAQTGSNNPEAPNLSEMKGSMQLSIEYTDGTSYVYQKPVGVEKTQDYSDVEPGEELAPETINGFTIVNVNEVPVVQAHQKWNGQEGPLADISRRANELGDENVQKLAGTKIKLDEEDGNKLHGVVTDVELLDKEGASPLYYQVRVENGFNGFYVLTCNKQGLDGNTNQWMWLRVENKPEELIEIPQGYELLQGYGIDLVMPK